MSNIPSDISNFLEYDETSKSKLRWKKLPGKNQKSDGDEAGVINSSGYYVIGFKRKLLYAHRVIFWLHFGICPSIVDHKDNNRSNNCIDNLRPASISENAQNRSKNKRSSNADKGLSTWIWSSKKRDTTYEYWRIRISVNNKVTTKKFLKSKYSYEFCKQYMVNLRNQLHREFANHGI